MGQGVAMRKNTRQALTAWRNGKSARPAPSIWSNGDALYSYATPLVMCDDDRVYLNITKYSPTTSCHQSALAAELRDAVRVDGVPRGFSGHLSQCL